MSIPTSAQQTPITQITATAKIADKDGNLSGQGRVAVQQLHDFVVNMSRMFPCNASTTSNVITLTLLAVQPVVTMYTDYDVYSFVADANSSGLVSAKVGTKQATLATLNVYKTNGSAQATTGDITAGLHYTLTFVDSLNSNAGGFVLR